ncbi:Disease resistance-like protein DSC1 [Citrus sinensis]|nr:Disease resistance-like protein DSC1 [Citrus sinensis]
MASSSSSHPRNNKYDVFLSFKGEDTRDNFTSHLYSALSQKGIETFIDNDLKRGDEISQSLVDAIEASSISIIIFSESYASSSWCLDELLRILECKTNYGQIVIPVFYRVDPSHVRKQSGNFGDSFSKLEEQFPDRMQTWRIALTEAANLSGFDSHVVRPESHLIEEIANEVLERVDDTFQSESKDLVGVESRIKEIEALLGTGSTDVYKLGIWGIGGIGQTTIAAAIFNKISRHFEGSYFAHNVRDADQTGRLPHLRQELLSALLGGENVKNIPNTGLNFQSKRLSRRKVKELGGVDALKLFSRFAFGRDHLEASYVEPTKEIVKYAQGVPLVLKVLGSFLFKRRKEEWESAIRKLENVPHIEIQAAIKISFDGLDDHEQNIFLDIACFLKEERRDQVLSFLDACGFFAEIGLRVLIDKSLITISHSNTITMHDLLQDMGREIIRKESIHYPGQRSRLCSSINGENKCKISDFQGPGFAELRYLHWHGYPLKSLPSNIHLEKLVLLEMPHSNIQQLWKGVQHRGKLKQKIIGACNIFTKTPNPSFVPPLNKLVMLDLSGCKSLKSLPAEISNLESLKKLNLSGCSKLKRLPEFSSAGNIEEIWLDGTAIEELPPSIGCLSRLLNLYLSGCKRLKSLPSSICKLKSLKVLNLDGCSNIQKLPHELGNLEALNSLYAKGIATTEVPSSVVRLNNKLYELSSDRSRRGDKQMGLLLPITLSIDGLHMTDLTCLYLTDCGITELPESLGQLCSLVELDLEKNNFKSMPESIIQLSNLKYLNISYCERLQSLSKLPCNLEWLFAHQCTALESLPSSGLFSIIYESSTQHFDLSGNFKLDRKEVRGIFEDALQDIQLMAAARWKKVREEGYFLEKCGYVIFPGNEIPKCFKFQSVGSSSSITLEMPTPLPGCFSNKNRVLGFTFSAIVAFGEHRVDYCDGWFEFFCELQVKSQECQRHHVLERCDIALIRYVESDHLVLGYYLFGDEDLNGFREYNCVTEAVAVQFYFQHLASSHSLERCGVKAFYLGKVQGRMPRFIPTDPNLVHHVAQLGKAQARMLKLVPIESNQAPHAVHLGKALEPPIFNLMASSSINSNINTTVSSFTFTSPIKLDRSNYTIWKSQILSSVRANGLEDLLDGSKTSPDQFLQSETESISGDAELNPAYTTWKRKDQLLLSWLMSSISIEILSLVVNSETSLELWTSLEQQFGSETSTKKPYYHVVVYLEANLAKISINEAYSMLLSHEARLEANQLSASKEAKLNYAANIAQTGFGTNNHNKKLGGQFNNNWAGSQFNNNWNKNGGFRGGYAGGRGGYGRNFPQGQGRGNWNGGWNGSFGNFPQGGRGSNYNGNPGQTGGFNGGFANGKGTLDQAATNVTCQIYFKPRHTAAECRNRFNKDYVSFNNPYQNPPRAAFLATSEGVITEGWYIDSGATHHITNNLQNLQIGNEYLGNQLLLVGNGQGLHISHIGYTCFQTSCSAVLHLRNTLCVPKLTKNLISVSKLLEDNTDITIEFVANMCFIKDKRKEQHLAQGIAKKGLYLLLSKNDFVSNSSCLTYAPSSMISVLNNPAWKTSDTAANNVCNSQFQVNSTKLANLFHQKFGHPNKHVLKSILSSLSVDYSSISAPDFCDACQYGPSSSASSPNQSITASHLPSPVQHPTTISPPEQSSQFAQQSLSAQTGHPMVTRSKAGIFKPKTYLAVTQNLEPQSVKAALIDIKWREAMQVEFDALQNNKTWTLVPREQAGKIVGNKWVFRVKYNPDGSISKYKVRLVAKGFHQTQGVDFFETFSPVVKPCTIRIILSIAVINHWSIRQLDVNNAFLNGILTEEVFMHQPEGFLHPQYPSHVCKLTKALYGLKQAPRAWYDRLKSSLQHWGFHTSRSDTSLFFQHKAGDIVMELIYVDDILITGFDNKLVEEVIGRLGFEFALKDLGDFNYFLGLEVTPSAARIHLSQTKYIGDLLKKAQMIGSKGCQTPMSLSDKLVKDRRATFENPSLYRSLIGSLQYITLTRPEIAFTVNKLSQFLAAPTVIHWQACRRLLRYLQSTTDFGLQFFSTGKITLTIFSDADWGSDLDDRKSVSGYCIYLGDNLVSWSSKKQQIVSRSSAESKYRALALAVSEVLWISYVLKELKMSPLQVPALHCDNKSVETLASNPKYHSRTKHIELDLHFVRDHIARNEVHISHVSSCDQVADVLTKPLAFDQFNYLRSKLNVLQRP